MENLKKCSKCGRELPVSEFWRNASTEDGLQTYCKECGNIYAKNRKKTPGGGNLKKIFMSDVYTKTLRKLVIIVSIFFLMLLKWEYLKKENVYSLYVSGMIWESIF